MVQRQSTIGVIGYGFVGKATAELGKIADLAIYDPFIREYNTEAIKLDTYSRDIVICCVPTPEGEDGHADLSILEPCIKYWQSLKLNNIFAIKSTIPAGTVDRLSKQYKTDKIIHNPEFLTERTHIEDFKNPTDVIVGGEAQSCKKLAEVYQTYYSSLGNPIDINICSAKEAELVKTVRNSFYATKVVFMNEIYQLSQKLGINYQQYQKILTNNDKHPWWGPEHTKVPGPDGKFGYGGKCFPKDTIGLLQLAQDLKVDLSILQAAIDKNTILRGKDDK